MTFDGVLILFCFSRHPRKVINGAGIIIIRQAFSELCIFSCVLPLPFYFFIFLFFNFFNFLIFFYLSIFSFQSTPHLDFFGVKLYDFLGNQIFF